MNPLTGKLLSLTPRPEDSSEKRVKKAVVLVTFFILFTVGIAGATAFFTSIRRLETVKVPVVVGMDVSDAIVKLEEYGLTATLIQRYTTESEKGAILTQDPDSGSSLRVGSRVQLLVSMGATIERIGDYRGKALNEVRSEVQQINSILGNNLLTIRTIQTESEAPAGTVISQTPETGTEVAESTVITLWVSEIEEVSQVRVPNLLNLVYNDALQLVGRSGVPFDFEVRAAADGEVSGYAVSQTPNPGAIVSSDTVINIEITEPPRIPDGWEFGIFELETELPIYDAPLGLNVEAVESDGTLHNLLFMRSKGGNISVPYMLPENSLIRVSFGEQQLTTSISY